MIPIYTEPSSIRKEFPTLFEDCVFCRSKSTTWHENTNSPVCVPCSRSHKVSDIPQDHGKNIRKMKRKGTFNREDSKLVKF